jgi:ligand-binding SRPBCC domain-containing protein
VRVHVLEREQVLPVRRDAAWRFFQDAHNLEAITPPFLRFAVVTPGPIAMGQGALIEYRLRLHGIRIDWLTRIEIWEPGRRFVDRQIRGPYALWHHTHTFTDHPAGTLMRDRVHYRLPLGILGALAHLALVRHDLEAIFDFRAREVARRLAGASI